MAMKDAKQMAKVIPMKAEKVSKEYTPFVLKPEEIRFQGRLTKKGFIFEFWRVNHKKLIDKAISDLTELFGETLNTKEYKSIFEEKFNSMCINLFSLVNTKASEKVTIADIRDKLHIQWIDFNDMIINDLLKLEFDFSFKEKGKKK